MNIWGFLLIFLGIIVVVGMFQQGFEGFKTSPLQSSWEASKTIGGKTVDAYQWGKEKIQSNSGTSGSLKNLGLPLCETNSSCNTLSECKDNLCQCIQGECFK